MRIPDTYYVHSLVKSLKVTKLLYKTILIVISIARNYIAFHSFFFTISTQKCVRRNHKYDIARLGSINNIGTIVNTIYRRNCKIKNISKMIQSFPVYPYCNNLLFSLFKICFWKPFICSHCSWWKARVSWHIPFNIIK